MIELELMRKFMAEVPFRLPHVRVFRRDIINTNVERAGRHFHVRAGVKGMADLYAIVEGGGHVEIECKAAKGRMAEEQEAWRNLMIRMRVPHLVLKVLPKEHPQATVDRWIHELSQTLSQ